MSIIDWTTTFAAIWRSRREILHPVQHLDPIQLEELLGIDTQKQQIIDNTLRFLNHQPANNALLWGSKGTGKSSLIKALLNRYAPQGLRVIEVDKEDLVYLPEIVDSIRDSQYCFIVYCDDLSFENDERIYKHLKSVLEGTVEIPPKNLLLYATSNRRHLMPEFMQDNLQTQLINGEIHYSDTVEEKTSLADRFGLWISFYPINTQQYLEIVDYYFKDYPGDREQLHARAKQFALARGSKSGRTAKQFFQAYHFVGDHIQSKQDREGN
ncbi:MAG: ATPase [Gammaproteobacteria bacterium SG8_11]|nr:MAG: ATPase [Gammaproteobacteria bacterium SG8_11]